LNKKSKLKERAFTVFFMFAITFVFISFTSIVYINAKDTIKLNESLVLKRAVLECSGLDLPKKSEAKYIEKEFEARVKEIKAAGGERNHYVIVDPATKQVVGYIFVTSGAGLWGEIIAVIGLKKDKRTIIGIDFIKQNETPGLGARIEESWFREQFVGRKGPFDKLIPEKEKPKAGEFQAITGATITSTAVKTILNKTIETASGKVSK